MRDRLTGPKLVQILLVLGILSGAFWLRTCVDDNDNTALEKENVDFCDISHNECALLQDGLHARARMKTDALAPEQPFELAVDFSDSQVKVVRSVLEGESMYMGTLPALVSEQEPGRWQGQALVGACTEASMLWAWVLDIEHNGIPRQLKFRFEVSR
ncbi:hypothetical protein C7H85_03355 [Zobellella endophytica]|uniref:Uncharacterized protein n=2 Tax=Zobellella endophytica TaxID=2116700 RepID=A0A2P7RCF5_9GAMM|nr:hypothetical protein C7H85_03355 [Zobellella endophytica]